MDIKWCIIFVVLLLSQHIQEAMTQNNKVRMCYVTYWSYRLSGFTPSALDPFLCTHVMYAFAYVTDDATSIRTVGDRDLEFYGQLRALRERNPSLKLLLSLGGADAGQTNAFVRVSSSPGLTSTFVANAVTFLRQHGFDGLDLDWEFPDSSTRTLFQTLVARLREGFDSESARTGNNRLLLTMAVIGNHEVILSAYDPITIANYVDYFLLMTYNLWGRWVNKLGHHTALDIRPQEAKDPELGRFSVNKTVKAWLGQGVSGDKLVLGLASYGVTARLTSPSLHSIGDSYTQQPGTPGPITKDTASATLAYYEICSKLFDSTSPWTSIYQRITEGVFAYSSVEPYDWVCFDHPVTFRAKTEYALSQGLAGTFLWSVDLDDWSGQYCGGGTSPLLTEVRQVTVGYNTSSTTLQPPTTTRTSSSTSTSTTTASTTRTSSTSTTTTTTTTPSTTTTSTTTTKPTTTTTTTTSPTTTTTSTTTTTTSTPPPPTTTSTTTTTTTPPLPTTTSTTTTTTPPPTTPPPPTTTPTTTTTSTTSTSPSTSTSTSTTSAPTTTTSTSSTTTTTRVGLSSTTVGSGALRCPNFRFRCPDVTSPDNPFNLHPDPTDCGYFYQCVAPGTAGSRFYRMQCPGGLHYDAVRRYCNWPSLAKCVPCDPSPVK